jgi:CRISPR-associated protein Cas1
VRILNTLYVVEHRARLSLQKKNVLVSLPDRRSRIPIESLDTVVLLGGAQVTSQALGAFVERGIRVSALARSGRLRFTIGGPVSGNVLLRVAQLRAADDPGSSNEIARCIVAGKLQNYRRTLQRWSWDASGSRRSLLGTEIEALAERVGRLANADGDAIRGIEGDGTRRYFKCLGAHLHAAGVDMPFLVRSRRPPRDEVNALLGYLYGVVLAEVVGSADSVGLDPQVGFLHGLRPGRPSLALDLIEELRPAVADRLAVTLLTRRQVRREHFSATQGRACYLTEVGRRVVIEAYDTSKADDIHHPLLQRRIPRWSLPTLQATLLARHLRGDISAYPPYVISA